MKKSEQKIVNEAVLSAWKNAEKAWGKIPANESGKRLRTCQALVYETADYYFLVSYRTVVAFIDKATDTCYDVLRYVYGFTRTSAQHIDKFDLDYGNGKWGCEHRMTYYPYAG